MGWRPVREAHAIERVRIIVEFSSALTSKLLTKSAQTIFDQSDAFGFDAKERVPSNVAPGVTFNVVGGLTATQSAMNGYLLRRHKAGELVEEVGFRDTIFGYVTTEYARWENFNSRLGDVFYPALNQAAEYTDLAVLRLEYWDRFTFDGESGTADASQLLHEIDGSVPKSAIAGNALWHSHTGWFEEFEGTPYLINRNLDANDIQVEDGTNRRSLTMYTLLEARIGSKETAMEDISRHLNEMHRRAVLLFGSSLHEDVRAKLGLNLEAYQNG